jgi:hypothetical protein
VQVLLVLNELGLFLLKLGLQEPTWLMLLVVLQVVVLLLVVLLPPLHSHL